MTFLMASRARRRGSLPLGDHVTGGVVKGSAIEGCGHFLPEECPAELIGVTADWYRYFESGRPVRVSPQFVSRLAKALRLQPYQEMTLSACRFSKCTIYPVVFRRNGSVKSTSIVSKELQP